jgi:hypothetical protein
MTGFYNHRLKIGLIGAAVIVLTPILLMLSESSPAIADISPTTQQFYGIVYNNDVLVTSGYVITALIGATKVGQTTTDSQGRYGYDPVFEVTASSGQQVNFSVNDHPALQTAIFQGGAVTELNLTCYGAASQMPQTSCRGVCCASPSCGISPKTLAVATVGYPYSCALSAQGGVLPYTWSISSGSLPPGLTLDSTLGVIKGVPTSPQTYSFTVQVNDNASNYLTLTTSIQVNPGTTSSQSASSQTSNQTASLTSNFLSAIDTLNVSGNVLNTAAEISSIDGRVRLKLAAGTVLELQGQSIIGAGNETNPPAASDGSVCIHSYSFSPAGATFSPAATMTLKYETPLPPGLTESALYIAYWNGSAWTKLDSTVDTGAKEVTTFVSHFTIFAVRGIPETTAQPAASTAGSIALPASSPAPILGSSKAASAAVAFAFSDLTATPETVGPDENVTLSVRVINSGASEATGDVVLEINGKDNIRKEVTLGPGKSQPVSFAVSESDPGNYIVSIGGLNAGFEVLKAASSGQQSFGLSTAIIGVIVAGCLLALVISLIGIFRRRPNS